MGDFKTIETQEEFDKMIQKRLEQKEREVSERFKDYLSPEEVAKIRSEYDGKIKVANDSLKAERDAITRQIKSCENTIDYIKTMVNHVLVCTGQEKVKGTCYSFAATTSETTSVDSDALNLQFMEAVEKKLRGGKRPVIPADVTIKLGASIKNIPEGAEIPAYYIHSSKPSVKFTKPRASKEDK